MRQARIRFWICYRQRNGTKCLTRNPARLRKCAMCGGAKPAPRKAKHLVALETDYDTYVVINGGEVCGVCGRRRTEKDRRLDRDHDHRTGQPRGLLCTRCNRWLVNWMTPEWLRAAADYLERTAA